MIPERVSYVAIARKYRPTTFDEMVGQEHVTRTLRNALTRNRIHHAFLFSGTRGVGKTTAARAFARALNCASGPTADPCGTCVSCVGIAEGRSPDLIEIDGASNNSVDDMREIRETVHYLPTLGKYKIYLVDEVHMLSRAAFNALLKTLEEPPPHVIFLFATTEPSKIPDTILSRVQRFDFKRIPVQPVVERLASIVTSEGLVLSEVSLRLIARAGDGSMRDSQSLLDKVISFSDPGTPPTDAQVAEILGLIDRSIIHGALAALVQGRPADLLAAIDKVYSFGFEMAQFSEELLEVLRNATFLRLSPEARAYIDLAGDEMDALAAIVKDVDPEVLHRHFAALVDIHDQVSRASRPRLVLEMATARLASPVPVTPIASLVTRLEEIERRERHAPKPPGAGSQPRRPR